MAIDPNKANEDKLASDQTKVGLKPSRNELIFGNANSMQFTASQTEPSVDLEIILMGPATNSTSNKQSKRLSSKSNLSKQDKDVEEDKEEDNQSVDFSEFDPLAKKPSAPDDATKITKKTESVQTIPKEIIISEKDNKDERKVRKSLRKLNKMERKYMEKIGTNDNETSVDYMDYF